MHSPCCGRATAVRFIHLMSSPQTHQSCAFVRSKGTHFAKTFAEIEKMTIALYTYAALTIVCCGFAGCVSVEETTVANHPAWDILNSFDCGDSAADRIIGGTRAALGQFPWMARLGYVYRDYDDGEVDWMCGGALITDRLVITAAHCLTSDTDQHKLQFVRLGEHTTTTDPDCELSVCAPPVQDRGIRNLSKHSSFNHPPFHNDLALVELDAPANLNDYVAPICLPQSEDQRAGVQIGEMVVAAGWGKMNMTTEERATVLQVVALPIVQPEMCAMFGKEFKMDESQICAGAQFNKDACGGDSGGPLMKIFDTIEGPKNFLMGVVSFGPTICGIRKPGVYSSATHFLHWILEHIVT